MALKRKKLNEVRKILQEVRYEKGLSTPTQLIDKLTDGLFILANIVDGDFDVESPSREDVLSLSDVQMLAKLKSDDPYLYGIEKQSGEYYGIDDDINVYTIVPYKIEGIGYDTENGLKFNIIGGDEYDEPYYYLSEDEAIINLYAIEDVAYVKETDDGTFIGFSEAKELVESKLKEAEEE